MADLLVKLQRDWFGPDAKRYRTRDNPNVVPARFRDALPADALIVDDKFKGDLEKLEPQVQDPREARERLEHNAEVDSARLEAEQKMIEKEEEEGEAKEEEPKPTTKPVTSTPATAAKK